MTKTYILSDILKMFSLPVNIEYRALLVEDDEEIDVLMGFGTYVNGELIITDGDDDDFHLDDEFCQFRYVFKDDNVDLVVWDRF